nr:hypothetical protein [Tanacetum cinerariifolium]
IVMENPNHPNDPNVPEGDQAPTAPDGFAPQWIGEYDPNNNNGDTPRATMTISSTYEVGGPSIAAIKGPSFPLPTPGLPVPPIVIEDLGTRLGNLEYRHGVLLRKMEEVSDAEVADSIAIGEIHPRVATVREQVHVMESQAGQVVSRLKEIKTRVQQVESRVDTHPSGQMAVQGQDVIVGSSEQEINVLVKLFEGENMLALLRIPVGKRYLRWVEAVMVSPEVENEKWRRLLLHLMRDTFGASTGGREEDFFPQNRMSKRIGNTSQMVTSVSILGEDKLSSQRLKSNVWKQKCA